MEMDEPKLKELAEQIILSNGIEFSVGYDISYLKTCHLNTHPVYAAGKHVGYVLEIDLGDDGAFRFDPTISESSLIHGMSSYEDYTESVLYLGQHQTPDGVADFALMGSYHTQDSMQKASYTIDYDSNVNIYITLDREPFPRASIAAFGFKSYLGVSPPTFNMDEAFEVFERHYPDHLHLLAEAAPAFTTTKLSADRFKTARQFTEQYGHFNIIESGFLATLIAPDRGQQPQLGNSFSILSHQGRVKNDYDHLSLGYKHYLNAMVKRYIADNGSSLPAIIHTRDLVEHYAIESAPINIPPASLVQP